MHDWTANSSRKFVTSYEGLLGFFVLRQSHPRTTQLPAANRPGPARDAIIGILVLHTCVFRSSDVPRLQRYSRLDQVSQIVLDCCGLIIYIQVVSSPFPIYLSSPAVNFFEMTTVTTGQAHPQACKCLCSSSHLGHARTAPLVAASQARASARLPVLPVATWPRAWLLPCSGSGASTLPILSCKISWWHPSIAGVFSGHAHPASPDLPRVNQYRIKLHQMDSVHVCTWGGYGSSRCGCGVFEPDLYYIRAEPKVDEGNRHKYLKALA